MIDRTTGIYSVSEWAAHFNVKPRAVNEWIDRFDIPFRKPGNERYVDAADFWAAIPKQTPGGCSVPDSQP